jgi:hypothetical protein
LIRWEPAILKIVNHVLAFELRDSQGPFGIVTSHAGYGSLTGRLPSESQLRRPYRVAKVGRSSLLRKPRTRRGLQQVGRRSCDGICGGCRCRCRASNLSPAPIGAQGNAHAGAADGYRLNPGHQLRDPYHRRRRSRVIRIENGVWDCA